MLSSLGTLLALGALTGLSAGAVPRQAFADDSITVAVCGEHGTLSIPLGRLPTDPRRDCQWGCHAVCHRKGVVETDED